MLVYGIPSTMIAFGTILTAYWAKGAKSGARDASVQAQQTHEQVASPNGLTTGDAVDQIRRDMTDIRLNQAEFKESVRASRILTAEVQNELRRTRDELSAQITQVREDQQLVISRLDKLEEAQ